jgi:hypothetical protein
MPGIPGHSHPVVINHYVTGYRVYFIFRRKFGAPADRHDENRGQVEYPTPNFQISFNSQAPNFKRDKRLGIWVCHMREPADSQAPGGVKHEGHEDWGA